MFPYSTHNAPCNREFKTLRVPDYLDRAAKVDLVVFEESNRNTAILNFDQCEVEDRIAGDDLTKSFALIVHFKFHKVIFADHMPSPPSGE